MSLVNSCKGYFCITKDFNVLDVVRNCPYDYDMKKLCYTALYRLLPVQLNSPTCTTFGTCGITKHAWLLCMRD